MTRKKTQKNKKGRTGKRIPLSRLLEQAINNHRAGRLEEAEKIYRRILAAAPANAVASRFYGILADQSGRSELAVELLVKAISIQPGYAEAHNNLGVTFQGQGKHVRAAQCYRKALELQPDYAEACFNLSNALVSLGRINESIAALRRTLIISPDHVNSLNNLGARLNEKKQFDEALDFLRKAVSLRPDYALAHYNLANSFWGLSRLDEAESSYHRALALDPDSSDTWNNLGIILHKQARYAQATDCFRRALDLDPAMAAPWLNMGNVLQEQGDLDGAMENYRQAVKLAPDDYRGHSTLLFTMNYSPDITQEDIYLESLQWYALHAGENAIEKRVFTNRADTTRPLRIGFVSPDFRIHSVASFFVSLLSCHNSDNCEMFCYADVANPDNMTKRLQKKADGWRFITGLEDEEAAAMILEDRIDILVDLAGHTRDNRLMLFARKPAPVQVSWLGYPNTTGMRAIDYRLTDNIADPVGVADTLHSEKLIRMPHTFLCYQPDSDAPDVSPPRNTKDVTFGSFNNSTKITLETIKLWAGILRRVENGRLLLKSKQFADPDTRKRYERLFAAEGIIPERIDFYGRLTAKRDHFALYGEVDIGLDPLPYNGTTTTCEALWMGVPVLTLLGSRHGARVGASILHCLGLPELIAETKEEYVSKAVALAGDRARLTGYRASLREKMAKSPLTDGKGFAQTMEKVFREIWSEKKC